MLILGCLLVANFISVMLCLEKIAGIDVLEVVFLLDANKEYLVSSHNSQIVLFFSCCQLTAEHCVKNCENILLVATLWCIKHCAIEALRA